ncbi:MAG: alpha/beta fold hydrolase [Peptococcaceae bacterium]|jgi:pimeloyl-ACP methyl ester carboxylesterase|nr:alpha/beta fold hydrolase [Peptococcaceae bacterium]
MKRAYIDIPQGQMHYRYAGAGEPALLLHGSASHSGEFEAVGNLLARRFQVYAIDLLGFGASDRPPVEKGEAFGPRGEPVYSIRQHGATVLSFMDAMSIERAMIFGVSAGAAVAAVVAREKPERARRLVLAAPYMPGQSGDDRGEKDKYPLPEYQADGRHLLEYWRRINYGEAPQVNHHWLTGYCLAGDLCESLRWALAEAKDEPGFFDRPRVPALILRFGAGGNNGADDADGADAVTEWIDGAGLYGVKTHAEAIVDAILRRFA